MKPAYEIYADGNRVTPQFVDRLVSMTVVDEAKENCDSLSISISDPRREIAAPRKGVELLVLMGYAGALQEMGTFVVDSVKLAGPPDVITLEAAAVTRSTSSTVRHMRSQKTRLWPEGTTLGDLVRTVAQEHDLEAAIAAELASVVLPATTQTEEGDFNLLIRLARNYGATVKPTFGRLVFTPDSSGTSASGQNLPSKVIRLHDCKRWSYEDTEKERFTSVVARYHDLDTGEDVEVQVGDGDAIKRLSEPYPSRESAYAAAKGEYGRVTRKAEVASLALSIGTPGLRAEMPVTLEGFRGELAGDWIIKRSTHTMTQNGYETSLELQVPR